MFLQFTIRPVLVAALALSLAGCSSTGQRAGQPFSPQNPPSLSQLAKLNDAYQRQPGNAQAALAYASALSAAGDDERALSVMGDAARRNPADTQLQASYGKALLRAGKPREAIKVLASPQLRQARDASVFNALGTAYDQTGQTGAARAAYAQALQIKPDDVAALNNSAMSHMLAGDPAQAEALLRQALARNSAHPKLRQNLALAIGLQGRFEEARKVASADLPQEDVDANLAYLEQMLAQQDTWKQLKKRG